MAGWRATVGADGSSGRRNARSIRKLLSNVKFRLKVFGFEANIGIRTDNKEPV